MKNDKALEWINRPHPARPLFIGDLLVNVIVDTAVFAAVGLGCWLLALGLDSLFRMMGV